MTANLLLVDCPDEMGLIHRITGVLHRAGLNIVGNQEFVDAAAGRFFMRTEFVGNGASEALADEVRALLPGARVRVATSGPRTIVVLATREPHCLGDLLLRHEEGELPARIAAVVSNHATLGSSTSTTRSCRRSHTAADMAQAGRDVEKTVLARGLRLLLEERVFLRDNRAVVFES